MRTSDNSGFSKYHKERNGNSFYLSNPQVQQPTVDVIIPDTKRFKYFAGWQSGTEMLKSMPEHLTLHDIWGFAYEPPRAILEIGCGLGRCSVWLAKYHGWTDTKFYLMDSTDDEVNYGMDDGNHGFYNDLELTEEYFTTNVDNPYEILDAKDPNALDAIGDFELDAVCSFMAFGFHWPFNDYLRLVTPKVSHQGLAVFGTRGYDKGGSKANIGGKGARAFITRQLDDVDYRSWTLMRDARMPENSKSSCVIFERRLG